MEAPRLQERASGKSRAQYHTINHLMLPNELLHKILTSVISDSVHNMCTSRADPVWEINMLDTFHQVSPTFKEISSELISRAFDIPKTVRSNDESLLKTVQGIFGYLVHLGIRLRDPADWPRAMSYQTIDCSASSLVFAYALYLSCLSLRRNATRSPRDVFESTFSVVSSALTQANTLCGRVRPSEMTILLREGIAHQERLARDGYTVVQGFSEMITHSNSMRAPNASSISIAALRSKIHASLEKVEVAYVQYTENSVARPEVVEPGIHELPGVIPCLRKLSIVLVEDDEYKLRERISIINKQWRKFCPFFAEKAANVAAGNSGSGRRT